jgi:hypothetical protein
LKNPSQIEHLSPLASYLQSQRNLEAFLGLALKAQAQSRAIIQAVVELKYPRQMAFVEQANISHGPQRVNNGPSKAADARSHAEENQVQQNKLLEDQSDGRTYLDSRATTTAGRSDPALESVEADHGRRTVEGKAKVSGNAYTDGGGPICGRLSRHSIRLCATKKPAPIKI